MGNIQTLDRILNQSLVIGRGVKVLTFKLLFFVLDQIPPMLTSCPSSIITLKSEEPSGTSVTFDIPTVRDNLPPNTLTLVTSPSDITSPYLFTQTLTEVSYNFTDHGGNSVVCKFTVSVYGKFLF